MSRFQIVKTIQGEEKIGGATVLNVKTVGPNSRQTDDIRYNGRVNDTTHKYLTGLNPEHLDYCPAFLSTPEKKEMYKKHLEKDLERLKKKYLPSEFDETNSYFWKERQMGKITIDASSIETTYFDTEANPDHIILKYAILAGSYDMIAPTKEWAELTNAPYYISTIEEEEQKTYAPVNEKLKAGAELYEFIEKSNENSLLWFAWGLDKDTQGFTHTNSKGVISQKLVEFLEGKLTKSNATKKKCASKILEELRLWREEKEKAIAKAVFNAAEYYNHIYHDKGFYITVGRRTKLLPSREDSIDLLMDPVNRDEFLEIQDAVKQEFRK